MSLLPLLRRVPPRAFARFASSSSVPAVKISGSDLTASQKAPGQSPNVPTPWSTNQNPKPNAWDTARAEQVDVSFQPDALSAMGLVREQPVAMLHSRTAVCDGGELARESAGGYRLLVWHVRARVPVDRKAF